MYIPEFACGFIVGALVECALLIAIALIIYKRNKQSKGIKRG